MIKQARIFRFVFLGSALLVIGCSGEVRFEPDRLAVVDGQVAPAHAEDIHQVLTELFGTPDEPRVPAELAGLLNLERLNRAAGPVRSHQAGVNDGLYRRHCARCHGVTGNGWGPMAVYQQPYPRDFRRGVFKFTSTPRGVPPTDNDLHASLVRGSPGTAMPSFRLLNEEELAALVAYTKYLSIRGQLEQRLISFAADELDYDPLTGEQGAGLSLASADDRALIVDDMLGQVAARWRSAQQQVITPATPPAGFPTALVDAGRALFGDRQRLGCGQCHPGESNNLANKSSGSAPIKDYDIWNWRHFEFARKTASLSGRLSRRHPSAAPNEFARQQSDLLRKRLFEHREVVTQMPPPVVAKARRLGVQPLRGGANPVDLFRHLQQGIDGTPMPAIGATLSDEEIWSLVAYVLAQTNREAFE